MEGLALVDGKLVPAAEARVPLSDRGYLLGDGVFETMRAQAGKVFRLNDHMARLEEGLRTIGLSPSLAEEVRAATDVLVQAGAPFGERLSLRVNLSTGPMDDIPGGDAHNITGVVRPFQAYPPERYAGVSCIQSGRKDAADPLSTIKSLSFLPYIVARRAAHAAGAHDALLINQHGGLAEATTANLFALRDGVVHAPGPASGALPGVTRTALLEVLADEAEVVEPLTPQQLHEADEAWLSNTTGGVVPITLFDGEPVGTGPPGDLARRLGAAYDAMVADA